MKPKPTSDPERAIEYEAAIESFKPILKQALLPIILSIVLPVALAPDAGAGMKKMLAATPFCYVMIPGRAPYSTACVSIATLRT